ncbi:MAG: hypothetical protein HY815_01520 [Candidatus Riflebacteria bacterium]|nr:hypothetical protein [Candidatus Riflebacteria bacterium]
MSRTQRLVALGTLCLMAVCGPAWASLSLSGPTGLVTIPTALTLHQYEFDLSMDWWSVKAPGGRFTFSDPRGAVGLMKGEGTGAEIGLVKPNASGLALTDTYVFGKYRIPGLLPGGPLAVGGIFSTDKHHYSSIFLVGSSAIARSFALHYGGGVNVYGDPLGWSWFGGRQISGRADPGFALFGAEFDYKRFKFNIDYNGSYLSYGVNFFPDGFFSLSLFKLGRGDLERTLGLTSQFGFGATVRF